MYQVTWNLLAKMNNVIAWPNSGRNQVVVKVFHFVVHSVEYNEILTFLHSLCRSMADSDLLAGSLIDHLARKRVSFAIFVECTSIFDVSLPKSHRQHFDARFGVHLHSNDMRIRTIARKRQRHRMKRNRIDDDDDECRTNCKCVRQPANNIW